MTQGIKVAQQGVDVGTATDYQLVMSSQWPTLTVVAQGSFTVNATTPTVIFQHGLGYLPAFVIFQTGPFNPAQNVNQLGQSELFTGSGFFVDNNTLQSNLTSPFSVPFTGYYYIFKQDLAATINPSVGRPTQVSSGKAATIGIEVAKKNQTLASVDTTNSLHPMVIHMMGQVSSFVEPPGFTIVHNLGYFPVFYLWSLDNGTAKLIQFRATASLATITVRGVQSVLPQPIAYIVLKDPLLGGN